MANEPRRILQQPDISLGGFTPSTLPSGSTYFVIDVAGNKTYRFTLDQLVTFLNSVGLSVDDASDTVKGIAERATQSEVDNGDRTGSTLAELFVSPPELKVYTENYVSTYVTNNTPRIAASTETTLTDAGDFFDFDTSALTPPVSGRQVIPVILEKGTAGGDFLFQSAFYQNSQTIATVSAAFTDVVINEDDDTAYVLPRSQGQVYKINLLSKNVELLPTSVVGANPAYSFGAAFNKSNNYILSGTDTNSTAYAINTLTDEITTGIPLGSRYSRVIAYQDKWFAVTSFSVSAPLKEITVNSSGVFSVSNVNAVNITNNSGLFIYKNFLYIMPYNTNTIVRRLDLNNIAAGYTTYTTTSGTYINGVVLGSKLYQIPYVSGNIRVYDFETNLTTTIVTPASESFYYNPILLGNKIYGFGNGNGSNRILIIDPSNDSVSFPATVDYAGFCKEYKGNVIGVPLNTTYPKNVPVEFLFNEPFYNPSNPLPFGVIQNNFTVSGNINRLASLEDYDVDFTEDGSGNITNVRVTMLTEGAKNVTLNLVYNGF